MVGIKKIIVDRNDIITIAKLRDLGYDKIVLFYAPHPKHTAAGLVESQMLVCAWHYKPRADRQGKKVGEK